eukprot:scaffold170575_cov30-Tisochrysis_lutea.AAC.3
MKEHTKALRAIWVLDTSRPRQRQRTGKRRWTSWLIGPRFGEEPSSLSTINVQPLTDGIGGNSSLPNFWRSALTRA